MSLTPTEELLEKVKLGTTLETWELEHLYSKLPVLERKLIAEFMAYLVTHSIKS